MRKYQTGTKLVFVQDREYFNIQAGDTATIVGHDPDHGFCVCFDRDLGGHDCDMPDVIPIGHGWWLLGYELDYYAIVRPDETDILRLDLKEVL